MKNFLYFKIISMFICLLMTFNSPLVLPAETFTAVPESSVANEPLLIDAPEITDNEEYSVPEDTESVTSDEMVEGLLEGTALTTDKLPENDQTSIFIEEVPEEESVGAAYPNTFKDISNPAHPFYEAVIWARTKGVTKGYPGTNIFGVNDTCTRGQLVCFIWNMAGRPVPRKTENPFRDIKAGEPYYRAILWAYYRGIAKGYGDGMFNQNAPCTRGQVATFLWRYYGMAETGISKSPFTDSLTLSYRKAVLWCYENAIAKGYSDMTFRDTVSSTRGQAIYMLYRSQNCPKLYMPSKGLFSVVTSSIKYTGGQIRPDVEIYLRDRRLIQDVDYETEYINNDLPGTATVIARGTSDIWQGSIRRIFNIALQSPSIRTLTSSHNGQMGVTWSESPYSNGYEIRYRTGDALKTITVEGRGLSKTISGVARGTRYKVDIRSYILMNGVRYYSAWSAPVSITTRNMYWKITQYASMTGNQCMAYTITDPLGRLVMIDGGWKQDADHIRSIIQANGNHVYAWIVTHTHPDHVGALNAILDNNWTGIRIDHIYTAKVNEARYIATQKDYDHIETYYKFRDLTASMKNVTWLKEDDAFSVIGLNFRVFHAWDKNVNALNSNLCNNGSLMFMMYGEQDRMLFCADTEKAVQDDILTRHKDELTATYVQTAHHGNWGLTKGFYVYVHARGAFFDSPSYITSDTSGKYDAAALIQYMREQGAKVFMLNTAPNTIIMY